MGFDGKPATGTVHVPVLLNECLEALAPKLGKTIVDGTLGGGGHTEAMLARGAEIIGLDWDEAALKRVHQRVACEVDAGMLRLNHAGFGDMAGVLDGLKIEKVDGILLDLGLSSDQLDDAGRGLSYHADGPLDMRMDSRVRRDAADILATSNERELERIFRDYGEEPKARYLAGMICSSRKEAPVKTTKQLLAIIEKVYPPKPWLHRAHPAARLFQALRVAVNGELEQLHKVLAAAPRYMAVGARLAVITFQPEEDRMVKAGFRAAGDGFKVWKKILPTEAEIESNPRARSAKLRVLERTA
ncbi:MAG TPA: 16S rRNA (cytosine(1402)-N(4))-methyltransferase RsmH [Alphaproteobacteria bacterium]|nr:16S rRNA (cytosine(1402)-N(4))-methyltransferase RsmH [Alphaproteobacteria bacterium]